MKSGNRLRDVLLLLVAAALLVSLAGRGVWPFRPAQAPAAWWGTCTD